MDFTITSYSSSDQIAVKEFILDNFKEFGFSYNSKYDFDLDDPSIYIKNGGTFYTLKSNKKVVGTIAVINKKNLGELKRMYIDKNYQGQGYGTLLFNKAIEFCKQKGFTKLELETNKKFKKAHIFYKKRGCKIIREDERSYYMEKEL